MTEDEKAAALKEAAETHTADCACWCCTLSPAELAGVEDRAYLTDGDREKYRHAGVAASRQQRTLESNPWDPVDDPEERAAWATGWIEETQRKLDEALRR